jgi:hypothetical protein
MSRIAGPLDPDERDDERPPRTAEGRAWVRWRIATRAGWYAAGARPYQPSANPTFWEKVAMVAMGTRNVDTCHAIGDEVLALSGIGFTATSGFAQLLIRECLLLDPERWVDVMAPAVHTSGCVVKKCEASLSGIGFARVRDSASHTRLGISLAVRAGGDGLSWSPAARDMSRTWVECCSELLRHKPMDAAVLRTLEALPPVLSEEARARLAMPATITGWGWTIEQQALWALVLAFALRCHECAERLVLDCVGIEPRDAGEALRAAPEHAAGYGSETYEEFRRIYNALPELFHFHLESI